MKKMMTISFVAAAGMFVAACQMTTCSKADANKPIKPLRVGVYDSRA